MTISINSGAVYLQKTRHIYDRFGNNGYTAHVILVSAVWGTFIATEFLTSRSTWRFSHAYPVAGLVVMGIALALFVSAMREIGSHALSNGNFFGQPIKQLGGIYRYIREPIYWSYAVWFLGLCLLTSQKVFLAYAVISIIGLVGFESWVERPTSSN